MTATSCAMPSRIAAGTPAFNGINRAMLLGGLATFALLYCVQPMMPLLAQEFALTAAQSSWALSISTLTLAFTLLICSALSERLGRKPMMVTALTMAALATIACAFVSNYLQLLVLRTALGIALGGMPAVAMAYLAEEVEESSLGRVIGLFIGASVCGGMAGRLLASYLSEYLSWRSAFCLMGAACLYAAWEFWSKLPAAQNFRPHQLVWRDIMIGMRLHFSDLGLTLLFCLSFLLMGSFVSLYNYIGYRLLAAPFHLSQSSVGAIASLYLLGMAGSVSAGKLVDRIGRPSVLLVGVSCMLAGLLLTLSQSLLVIVAGTALFTFSFFASHSVASSWVASRALAQKALASALYLSSYYLGSSVLGSFTGLVWASKGWHGVVLVLLAAIGLAFVFALCISSLAPAKPVSRHIV